MMMLAASVSGALVTTLLVIGVVGYILAAYPLYRIAKATSDRGDQAWQAWVPIMNVILMCRIAGITAWTALILLLGAIPVFGGLIVFVYVLTLWVKIGQRFQRTALGVIAGIVPVIGAWVFAFAIRPETA